MFPYGRNDHVNFIYNLIGNCQVDVCTWTITDADKQGQLKVNDLTILNLTAGARPHTNLRGWNIAVVDPIRCLVISVSENSFDTFLTSTADENMKIYLEEVPDGALVAAIAVDSAVDSSGNHMMYIVPYVLQTFGVNIQNVANRDRYAFLGIKGKPELGISASKPSTQSGTMVAKFNIGGNS